MKKIIIIAGPNGAGKTTFAHEFLMHEADCPQFINADLIARGLSPLAPEKAAVQAGKIMLAMIDDKVRRGESFAFETTLSGMAYARHIRAWRNKGYHVKLIFLSLPSIELALARVKMRVAQGGHSIADSVIRRRYEAGLRNFYQVYRDVVDHWTFYDNAGDRPVLSAKGSHR